MIKFKWLSTALLSAILLSSTAFGQSAKNRAQTYINLYKELAISEMLRTGVPASITLAQGIIETAGGQSELASNANNHFGIKCKGEWKGESYLYTDDAKNECFRKYTSVEESFKDHSDFLKNRAHYAFLFKLDPTDYEGWAKGLKKAGYATSPTYAQALIRTIVENNLQDFTLLAMQRRENGDDLFAGVEQKNQPETAMVHSTSSVPEVSIQTENITPVVFKENVTKPKKINASYPFNSIFNINEAKVIFAPAGTSLLALAANYNVAYSKLIDFNELSTVDILSENQLIYLQKKPKKGAKDVHVVEENETLHEIAQKEGVQLSAVLEYNNLQKGMQPASGEKIYLKYPAPTSPKLAAAISHKSVANM